MKHDFRKTLIVLVLSMTLALALAAVAQSLQPAQDSKGQPAAIHPTHSYPGNDASPLHVNNMLQSRPPDYPTPLPTPVPVVTPGPTRGPAVAASYPPVSPTPYIRPTQPPAVSQLGQYQHHPWDTKIVPYTNPVVPKITLTPRLPPKVVRTPPPLVRSAGAGHVPVNKMLQVNPAVVPLSAPTPMPSLYMQKGYGLPWNPPATPTPVPSGGLEPVKGYGLPWRPPVTPTPVPSGGLEPVKGYGLPWNPPVRPTPTVSPAYQQNDPRLTLPHKSPAVTQIPQFVLKPRGPGAGAFLQPR